MIDLKNPVFIIKKSKYLKAIDTLIQYYKGDIEGLVRCPLCIISEYQKIDCMPCPWLLFEGMNCARASHSYGRCTIDLRIERHPTWVKMRLKQLRQWKRKIQEL